MSLVFQFDIVGSRRRDRQWGYGLVRCSVGYQTGQANISKQKNAGVDPFDEDCDKNVMTGIIVLRRQQNGVSRCIEMPILRLGAGD